MYLWVTKIKIECVDTKLSILIDVVVMLTVKTQRQLVSCSRINEKAIEHRSNYVVESDYATINRVPTVGHYHCLNTAM